jgi:hypothetical protein
LLIEPVGMVLPRWDLDSVLGAMLFGEVVCVAGGVRQGSGSCPVR